MQFFCIIYQRIETHNSNNMLKLKYDYYITHCYRENLPKIEFRENLYLILLNRH